MSLTAHDALKKCPCCKAQITRGEWLEMPLVGVQACEGADYELELRTHDCGSTLSLEVPRGATHHRTIAELIGRLACSQKWAEACADYMAPTWTTRDETPLAEGGLTLALTPALNEVPRG